MFDTASSIRMVSMKPEFKEVEQNRQASQYIESHYEEIIRQAKKMVSDEESAMDMVHDVYVSIVKAEKNGEGYNVNKGNTGDMIEVSQFVFGRLKGYSKNAKYDTRLMQKLPGSKKNTSEGEVIASSSSGSEDYASLDSFQIAFNTAASYDDLETVEDELSVIESIQYCTGFSSMVGFDMIQIFKNLRILGDNKVDKSLFGTFREVAKRHDEFGEAFNMVVQFAMSNADRFDSIVAAM